MSQLQPSPRSEYERHLAKLGTACAFCARSLDLLISEHEYWVWVYAAFPYRKYHTLLVPKRHITNFSELTDDELLEIKSIIGDIESKYAKSGIVGEQSETGDQLFFCWRSRQTQSVKQPVAHLHLHVYPKFGGSDDSPLDPQSHDIDVTRLILAK